MPTLVMSDMEERRIQHFAMNGHSSLKHLSAQEATVVTFPLIDDYAVSSFTNHLSSITKCHSYD